MHTIPFVIDNQRASMAGVLNGMLAGHAGQGLDIATAYFNVGGWQLLREGLAGLGTFRLLLGDEPEAGLDLGLYEAGARPVKGLIRELASARFDEKTLRLVEQLVAFLRQDHVRVWLYTRGFLHAKCYLFYGDAGFERTAPVAAIVGSSNFTRAGLLSNKELNLAPEEVAPEHVRGLLFTYYKDTARYLYRSLHGDASDAAHWRAAAGEPHIRRIDSGADTRERASLVTHFAPLANNRPELVGNESEIDILISTDVLSEGQNLQDCGTLINYDLHWNPTRMEQNDTPTLFSRPLASPYSPNRSACPAPYRSGRPGSR